MVTSYTNRAIRFWLPLSKISEMDGRPVRARTADLYRVNEHSDGTSSTYEYFSEHSVAFRAVRNSYCSHVVPTRAGWRTAFWEIGATKKHHQNAALNLRREPSQRDALEFLIPALVSASQNRNRAFCTNRTRISASAQRTVRRLEVVSLMKACQKCACRLHVRVGTEFSYSPRLARVKDPLRVGKFEKASSSKLLKEFRLPYLDNPSSHARPHDGHTLVDSF